MSKELKIFIKELKNAQNNRLDIIRNENRK
jgi:hypothetical protein